MSSYYYGHDHGQRGPTAYDNDLVMTMADFEHLSGYPGGSSSMDRRTSSTLSSSNPSYVTDEALMNELLDLEFGSQYGFTGGPDFVPLLPLEQQPQQQQQYFHSNMAGNIPRYVEIPNLVLQERQAASNRKASTSSSSSRAIPKREYQCLYTGCQQKPFTRNADLQRHLQLVHGPAANKENYFCDYRTCHRSEEQYNARQAGGGLGGGAAAGAGGMGGAMLNGGGGSGSGGSSGSGSTGPFHRKDHYRDHLRTYHHEDIGKRGDGNSTGNGSGSSARSSRGNVLAVLSPSTAITTAAASLSTVGGGGVGTSNERVQIHRDWWRCAKCLRRVRARDEGWQCPKCRIFCDTRRRMAREAMI